MEIFKFLQWQWRKWELWQKMFILSMLLQIIGWSLGGEWGPWVGVVGAIIILAYLFKWAVLDSLRDSWSKYKEQKNKLFTTIKNSDN